MIHYFSFLYQDIFGNLFWLSFDDLYFHRLCCRDSSVDFTRSQHVINNLEEGLMAHLSSNNNVQRLFLISDEGNFICRHVEQIRTAARDGDCAFGVNRTVAVEFRPSPSNQISQYQMFSCKE